jgi:predicted HTH transcriptional regulator
MVELSDADLLSKLKNCEDAFVERKTAADNKDWLKTVVAFANSTPIGYPAVLFIGVKDEGTIEAGSETSIPCKRSSTRRWRMPTMLVPCSQPRFSP